MTDRAALEAFLKRLERGEALEWRRSIGTSQDVRAAVEIALVIAIVKAKLAQMEAGDAE